MTIGILGGGQLGRMLALAGYPLGLKFRFFDPAPESPVEELADLVTARFDDLDALERFPEGLQVVSYEFENVPVEAAQHLSRQVPVHPSIIALQTSQDRYLEKTLFTSLGMTPAPFAPVDTFADLQSALHTIGAPAILKTRRLGYDGKGQFFLRHVADATAAWKALGGVPLILEGYVAFDRELSQIAVRGRDGMVSLYPLVENCHEDGILRLSRAPAEVDPAIRDEAATSIKRVMGELDYVGVLAIEFFLKGKVLVANEMAPRVHNSGHWTIEGARTSQFENHLRAVLGWPLGSTEAVGHSAMVNLIGTIPETRRILEVPGAHLHLYGKKPRPGRKVGHVTIWREMREQVDDGVRQVQRILGVRASQTGTMLRPG